VVTKHPLVSVLKAKAADAAAWSAFLDKSYLVSAPSSAHVTLVSASEYVLSGVLERFLKKYADKCKPGADPIPVMDALVSAGASKDDFDLAMFDVAAEIEVAASAVSIAAVGSGGGAGAGSSAVGGGPLGGTVPSGWPPNPLLSNPLADPGNAIMMFKDTSKDAVDVQEERELTTLRADAQIVGTSQVLIDLLASMTVLKNNDQPVLLEALVDECKKKPNGASLLRLVQYQGNLGPALNGKYSNLANECLGIRNVLESRLFASLTETHGGSTPECRHRYQSFLPPASSSSIRPRRRATTKQKRVRMRPLNSM